LMNPQRKNLQGLMSRPSSGQILPHACIQCYWSKIRRGPEISQGKSKVMFALCCMVPSCIHHFMFIGKVVTTGESIELLHNMLRYCSEFTIRSNKNDPIGPWLDTTAHTVIMGLLSTWIFHSPEMDILFVHYSVQM
jgi:hypothetical protein